MSNLKSLIENKNIQLGKSKYFSAIIGETPSKGAKSPILWNAAFKNEFSRTDVSFRCVKQEPW